MTSVSHGKRFFVTFANSVLSLVIFCVLSIIYSTSSADKDWKLNSPYQMHSFALRRDKTSGIFERDPAKPLIAGPVKSGATSLPFNTTEALLIAMNCTEIVGSRCLCYLDATQGMMTTHLPKVDSAQTTWGKLWEALLVETEPCYEMSAAWQVRVWDSESKVLLGTLAWWAFSTAIVSVHIFIDWEITDWLYKGLVLVCCVLVPAGVGGYIIFKEEGAMSLWFMTFCAFLVQHLFYRIFIHLGLSGRNNSYSEKQKMVQDFDKRCVMASLTAFAVLAAARLSQIFSGTNDTDETGHIAGVAIAIGVLGIGLRLICGALESFDDEHGSNGKGQQADANEHRKGLVFAAQWLWMFVLMLALLLITTLPLDAGDGLVEGCALSKFALGLVIAAIVLQYPRLTSSHTQWMALQVLEGLARLIAFGVTLIYCVTGK